MVRWNNLVDITVLKTGTNRILRYGMRKRKRGEAILPSGWRGERRNASSISMIEMGHYVRDFSLKDEGAADEAGMGIC
jgi:hypothetical protein